MNSSLIRWVLLPLLLLPGAAQVSKSQEAAHIWRVCVTDFSLPPYLYNDPNHQGMAERLLVDAGRQVGLSVLLLRYPVKRCAAMLETQGLDASLAAPTPTNLQRAQFPMTKSGTVDVSKRLARINLVWVARPDSSFDWNGHDMIGKSPDKLLVGTRLAMAAAVDPLQAAGFKVDATSLTVHQLLQKVALKRVDLGVALQEEVELALRDPTLPPLIVLPRAFSSSDFYTIVRRKLSPETQEKVEAWWTAIGRLRDQPEYKQH